MVSFRSQYSIDSPIMTPTPLPTPFATLVRTPPTIIEGNFNITEALTIMYYNAPDVIIQQGVPYYSSPYNTPYTSTININIAAPYSDQEQEKYVVITDKAIEHCHPCSAIR